MGRKVSYAFCRVFQTSDVTRRDSLVIADEEDRIIGVFIGAPSGDTSFSEAIAGVEAVMAEVAPSIRGRGCSGCRSKSWASQCRACRERRGDFKAISVGVSYGGGQTVRLLISIQHVTQSPSDSRKSPSTWKQ